MLLQLENLRRGVRPSLDCRALLAAASVPYHKIRVLYIQDVLAVVFATSEKNLPENTHNANAAITGKRCAIK